MIVVQVEMSDSLRKCMAGELLAYRKMYGLSQKQFARMLRISERSYIDVEHGVTFPSAVTLLRFLLVLDDQVLLCLLSTIEEFLA